jgi:hypothetical protein
VKWNREPLRFEDIVPGKHRTSNIEHRTSNAQSDGFNAGSRGFRSCVLLAVFAIAGTWAEAQTRVIIPIERKHFRQALEYFPPPHATQIKTLLSGDTARMDPGGKIFMTGAKVTMFDENGELVATAETAECVFDTRTHYLTSTSHVHAVRLPFQDSIEGDGFSYQQTNSFMVISNNVRTVAHHTGKLDMLQ